MANARTWGKRIGLGGLLILVAGGAYAGLQWKQLNARYADYKLRTAPDDEARHAAARKLLDAGEAGTPYLIEALRGSDAERCIAVTAMLRDRLRDLAPTDPQFATICRPYLQGFAESLSGLQAFT